MERLMQLPTSTPSTKRKNLKLDGSSPASLLEPGPALLPINPRQSPGLAEICPGFVSLARCLFTKDHVTRSAMTREEGLPAKPLGQAAGGFKDHSNTKCERVASVTCHALYTEFLWDP